MISDISNIPRTNTEDLKHLINGDNDTTVTGQVRHTQVLEAAGTHRCTSVRVSTSPVTPCQGAVPETLPPGASDAHVTQTTTHHNPHYTTHTVLLNTTVMLFTNLALELIFPTCADRIYFKGIVDMNQKMGKLKRH